VRISVHLTEAATGAAAWSQRFDRDLHDIFALQDEIAEQIAGALSTAFSAPAQKPIPPAAYDLFLRSKSLKASPEAMRANIASLEAVVAEAPHFADGWARLAAMRAWHATQLPYAERSEEVAKARIEIARCRAIDPDNPETGYADFWLAPPIGDYIAKEAGARRMLEATPNASDAHALAAFHLINVGRCREALVHGRIAMALNPRDWTASISLSFSLWGVGSATEAAEALEAHLLSWPDDNLAAAGLIALCAHQGRWDRFDALIEPRRLQRYPLREHAGLIAVCGAMRHPTEHNIAFIREALAARIGRTGTADPIILFWSSHLGLGAAVHELMTNASFGPTGRGREQTGVVAYRTLAMFTALYPTLLSEPHFPEYCARLGLVDYWIQTGAWPDCADAVDYDFRAACAAVRHLPCDQPPALR
jgi:hypothetical protein